MTARALEPEVRTLLLEGLAALKSDDDDAVAQDPKWFLPLAAHARALRPETLVIRGGRGAGKTALYHFLGHVRRHPSLSQAFPSSASTTWVEGFGTLSHHPRGEVVGAFAEGAADEAGRSFWLGLLCHRLAEELLHPGLPDALVAASKAQDPAAIADAARHALVPLGAWLDALERDTEQPVVITYDALDRIGGTVAARTRATSSLLAMWQALADRYRRLRPKIFVREDLFQGSLSAFPDASKLDARSASLDWRVEDLYRVLIKHMANTSDSLADWIQDSAKSIPLTLVPDLGYLPPETLPETGRASRKHFVDHLAGEFMGTGGKKGYTYLWIPNRLQDAHTRVVPRSILSLIRHAAAYALRHGPAAQTLRLLHPTELAQALVHTSERRVQELREEFPVVARLESLRGRSVMLERPEVVRALGRFRTEPDDGYGADGEEVLRALVDLGVMSQRSDGRIDVPDIYRSGFDIKRKGGVKRPR